MSLALVVGSVNAACLNFRPPPAPLAPEVAGDAPSQIWSTRAGRRFVGTLATHEGILYGAGLDRKVYAVDLASGRVLWSSRASAMLLGGVLVAGDTLFTGSGRPDGRVYAIDRITGRTLWKTRTGPISAPLTLAGDLIIAETSAGDVVALERRDGADRWRRKLGVARAAAVATDSALLIATTDSLFRLRPESGRVTHRAVSPGAIVSPLVALDGALAAGTTDSLVVAIRSADLGILWQAPVDAPVLTAPAVVGDTLFVATSRGTLYRITARDSVAATPIAELEWPVTAPVTVLDGEILLGGADGTIRALRSDGREVWRVRVWRPVELGPVPLPDGLLAVGGNGDLHRYRR